MALSSPDTDDKIKGMTGPKGQKSMGKKVGRKIVKVMSSKGGKK